MDNFARCLGFSLRVEAGFTSDPADPGNWTGGRVGAGMCRGTKFGISAAAYPELDIAALSEADAQAIYRRDYWDKISGDALGYPLALVTFDAAVNAGPTRAVIWLQQALGVYADGALGKQTLAALGSGDADGLARDALARRIDFSARLPGWSNFGLGWSRRFVALAWEASSAKQENSP
jgi:lysozyme family protein